MSLVKNKQILINTDFNINNKKLINVNTIEIINLENQLTSANKFLTLDSNNITKYRTNSQVLEDINALSTLDFFTNSINPTNVILNRSTNQLEFIGINIDIEFDNINKTVTFIGGVGSGGVDSYTTFTDGNNTSTPVGSDTFKFRGDGISTIITNNDPVHGDNVLLTNIDKGSEQNIFKNIALNSIIQFSALNNSDTLDFIAGSGITLESVGSALSGSNQAIQINNLDRGSEQNIFKNIEVSGQSTIIADNNNDTLTFVAGSNITITTNSTTDSITINSNQNTFSTISVSGQNNLIADNSTDTLTFIAGDGLNITTDSINDTLTFSSNQNTFNTISVSGQSNVVADSINDTLTFINGENVIITTNATNDSITFNANNIANTNLTVTTPNRTLTLVDNVTNAFSIDTDGKLGMLKFDTLNGTELVSINANLTVTGNLLIQGTTTTINSETIEVSDNIILLNSNAPSTPTENCGIEVERGNLANVFFQWNETQDYWELTENGTNFFKVWHSGNDGINSGLDADLLDGQQGAFYLDFNNLNNKPNIFNTISVSGQNNVVADNINDTLTLIQGSNITITTDSINDTITISSVDTNIGNSNLIINDSTRTLTFPEDGAFIINSLSGINYIEFNDITDQVYINGSVTLFVESTCYAERVVTPILNFGINHTVNGVDQFSFNYNSAVSPDLFLNYNNINKFLFTTNGDFHADGNIVASSNSVPSDIRLKENIKPITNSLETISKLKGVTYDWKDGYKKGKHDFGFIAQEVEEVLPEMVYSTNIKGEMTKTVDYAKLTAILVETIKELNLRIQNLEDKLDSK